MPRRKTNSTGCFGAFLKLGATIIFFPLIVVFQIVKFVFGGKPTKNWPSYKKRQLAWLLFFRNDKVETCFARSHCQNFGSCAMPFSELPSITALDFAAFSPYGTQESADIFQARLETFPAGFIVIEDQAQIVAYGSSEKWLAVASLN